MTAVETQCDKSKMTFFNKDLKINNINFYFKKSPPSQLGFTQFKPLDNGENQFAKFVIHRMQNCC